MPRECPRDDALLVHLSYCPLTFPCACAPVDSLPGSLPAIRVLLQRGADPLALVRGSSVTIAPDVKERRSRGFDVASVAKTALSAFRGGRVSFGRSKSRAKAEAKAEARGTPKSTPRAKAAAKKRKGEAEDGAHLGAHGRSRVDSDSIAEERSAEEGDDDGADDAGAAATIPDSGRESPVKKAAEGSGAEGDGAESGGMGCGGMRSGGKGSDGSDARHRVNRLRWEDATRLAVTSAPAAAPPPPSIRIGAVGVALRVGNLEAVAELLEWEWRAKGQVGRSQLDVEFLDPIGAFVALLDVWLQGRQPPLRESARLLGLIVLSCQHVDFSAATSAAKLAAGKLSLGSPAGHVSSHSRALPASSPRNPVLLALKLSVLAKIEARRQADEGRRQRAARVAALKALLECVALSLLEGTQLAAESLEKGRESVWHVGRVRRAPHAQSPRSAPDCALDAIRPPSLRLQGSPSMCFLTALRSPSD